MSLYECRGCGRKKQFDDECCGRLMRRHANELSCSACGNRVKMPSCCGEEMVRVGL